MKRKICVVITARPSYSRIKTALSAIQNHSELELQLVAAGSTLLERYGNAVEYMEQNGYTVAARVYTILEGENLVTSAKSTGLGLVELTTVIDNLQPDVVITIADRYETLATAMAASYMNIPVAHVQGGEVTGSIDEKVRHAVTKLSNLHFVANEKAAERIVRMGEDPETVFVTGCPSVDLAVPIIDHSKLSFDPFEVYGGAGPDFDISNGYIVVMQHPVTTEYEKARYHVTETLRAVQELELPTLWFWPNVDAGSDGTSKGIRVFRENEKIKYMRFFKNMSSEHFLQLIYHSRCIVGNSSVGIRECSYLGIPTVNIGSRQKGRDRGQNVIDVTYNQKEIVKAIQHQLDHGHYEPDHIYGDGRAGERIADILSNVPLKVEKMLTY